MLPSGQLLAQTDQRNRRSPTEFGHTLPLADDQRGLVADTSLGRQRKPA
jgi:hypothetical protein